MSRRLRIVHLMVQPVLGWDDGEEITPGPPIQAQSLPLSQVRAMLDDLPAEVGRIAAQIEAEQPADTGD